MSDVTHRRQSGSGEVVPTAPRGVRQRDFALGYDAGFTAGALGCEQVMHERDRCAKVLDETVVRAQRADVALATVIEDRDAADAEVKELRALVADLRREIATLREEGMDTKRRWWS